MSGKIIALAEWATLHGMDKGNARRLAAQGRLPGAYQSAGIWLLPSDTPKPPPLPAGRPAQ